MTEKRKQLIRRILLAVCTAAVVLALAIIGVVQLLNDRREQAREPWLDTAAAELDRITIDAKLDPASHSMAVTQTLMLTSRTAEPRQELVLRSWANAFMKPDTSPLAGNTECCPDGFSAGSLVLEEATVVKNGIPALTDHLYRDDARTVLALPLEESWQQGESLLVTLRYTVHFPHAKYRFGWWENTFMAGHAFIVPALWQNGAYRTDAWQALGDPLSGECADYTLSITAPKGYRCAVGGTVTATSHTKDYTTWVVHAPAVRDVGLVLSTELEPVARTVDGIRLTAYAADRALAGTLLGHAADMLEAYNECYVPYPFEDLTVCALPLGVSGAEYTALCMVADTLQEDELELTAAHELAHQWWYALVGSDSQTHPWLDEALCEYSLLEYVEHRYGLSAREDLRMQRIEPSMRITVAGGATPGAPLDYFETETDYAMLVYGRAAAFLCAADELLSGRLAQVLGTYAQTYALAIADRADLARVMLEAGGVDIEPLMVDFLDTYLIN